jgi:hypothetical protein
MVTGVVEDQGSDPASSDSIELDMSYKCAKDSHIKEVGFANFVEESRGNIMS